MTQETTQDMTDDSPEDLVDRPATESQHTESQHAVGQHAVGQHAVAQHAVARPVPTGLTALADEARRLAADETAEHRFSSGTDRS